MTLHAFSGRRQRAALGRAANPPLVHEATDVREIAMGSAEDSVIARHVRENAFCLITRDKDFGDIRNYPPGDYGGIIILDLPDDFPV